MIGDTNVRAMPVAAGTQISTLEVGTLVKINENGAPVEYLIVNQGNPDPSMYDASCDGYSDNDYKNTAAPPTGGSAPRTPAALTASGVPDPMVPVSTSGMAALTASAPPSSSPAQLLLMMN